MTFTAAEIEGARKNPRAGDVWRAGHRLRYVYRITPDGVTVVTPKLMFGTMLPWGGAWSDFCHHATLVRRGA